MRCDGIRQWAGGGGYDCGCEGHSGVVVLGRIFSSDFRPSPSASPYPSDRLAVLSCPMRVADSPIVVHSTLTDACRFGRVAQVCAVAAFMPMRRCTNNSVTFMWLW